MSFPEILKLYNNGAWNDCYELFKSNFSESRTEVQSDIKLDGLDEMTKSFLFENNAIVCEIIVS